MAPAYKLTYFDGRGLAETSRFLMIHGGIEYEDCRINRDEWPQLKNKFPFGQLPVLEHNGKVVAQSIAIARYLAKRVKLAGNDDWENLEIDSIVDTIDDLQWKLLAAHHEQDEARKKVIIENGKKDVLPYYLPRLEAIVKKNKGFLAVGRLTWADFFWACNSTVLDEILGGDNLANYPELKAARERVNSLPVIKKWIEVRPVTPW